MHRSQAGLLALAVALGPANLLAQTPAQPSPAAPSDAAPEPQEPPKTPEATPAPSPKPPPAEPSTPEPAPAAEVVPEAEPEPVVVPRSKDTLGGHFVLGLSAALAAPFSNLDSATDANDLIGIGPGFGVDAGIGVSRAAVLGLYGQFIGYSSPDACADCSGKSFAGGLFVRYHLVQGMRFDPWISAGVGFRSTSVSRDPAPKVDFSGPDWLRLSVGGDWYPLSVLGLGPFVELDLGSYFKHTPDADTKLNVNFLAGARIVLDFPGK